MINFRPLRDQVVVRRIDTADKTVGGVIIPETVKEKSTEAEVLAVGRGLRRTDGITYALDVKVGDRVLLNKWGGNEVVIDDQKVLILKESELLGIIGHQGHQGYK